MNDATLLAALQRLGVKLDPNSASGVSGTGDPMSRLGISKHGKYYRIDTSINGHKVREGGHASAARAAERLYQLQTDPAELRRVITAKVERRRETGPTVEMILHEYTSSSRVRQLRSSRIYHANCRHLGRLLGTLEAESIRQHHIDDYQSTRLAEPDTGPKTVFNELALLRTSMIYAWRCDRLPDRPKFVLTKPKTERKRVSWQGEIRALLDAAELPLRRVILAAWSRGMRAGEICAAQWSWLNPHTKELTIPAESSKNGIPRAVPLSGQLWQMLQQQPRHPEFVFCRLRAGANGRGSPEVVPWAYYSLWQAFKEVCGRVGASGLRLHDLRRSMASVAQSTGHGQPAVRALGGWEDVGVMQRVYSQASPALVAAVVSELEAMALGGSDAT